MTSILLCEALFSLQWPPDHDEPVSLLFRSELTSSSEGNHDIGFTTLDGGEPERSDGSPDLESSSNGIVHFSLRHRSCHFESKKLLHLSYFQTHFVSPPLGTGPSEIVEFLQCAQCIIKEVFCHQAHSISMEKWQRTLWFFLALLKCGTTEVSRPVVKALSSKANSGSPTALAKMAQDVYLRSERQRKMAKVVHIGDQTCCLGPNSASQFDSQHNQGKRDQTAQRVITA
ncbi:hypothetical protein SRHO_G00214380 [Serrasalmus rhombeus]